MNKYGLSKDGFKKKSYADIIQDMEVRAKGLFGDDISLLDSSPLSMFLQVCAWELKDNWQLAEDVYYSAFVDTSEGISLDNVGKYISLQRKPKQKSLGNIIVEGNEGVVVPVGFRVSDEGGKIYYEVTKEVTIKESKKAVVEVEAVVPGVESNCPQNTITRLATPIAGVRSINNPEAIIGGKDVEDDREFRERYYNSLSKGGTATIKAIRTAILSLPRVRAVKVEENTLDVIDDKGRPPHSVHCYVLDGNREEIAKTILETKAAGIETVGEEVEYVLDEAGDIQEIKFDFAIATPVYINIKIMKDELFNIESEEEIRANIIRYVGGIDDEGVPFAGLSMGERLVHARIVKSIIDVVGIEDITIETSKDNINFSAKSIDMGMNEVAQISYENMVIIDD